METMIDAYKVCGFGVVEKSGDPLVDRQHRTLPACLGERLAAGAFA